MQPRQGGISSLYPPHSPVLSLQNFFRLGPQIFSVVLLIATTARYFAEMDYYQLKKREKLTRFKDRKWLKWTHSHHEEWRERGGGGQGVCPWKVLMKRQGLIYNSTFNPVCDAKVKTLSWPGGLEQGHSELLKRPIPETLLLQIKPERAEEQLLWSHRILSSHTMWF